MRLQEKSEQHGVVPYVLEKAAVPEDWILLEGGIGEGGRQTVDKRAAYLVQDLFLGFIIAVKGCPGNTGTADQLGDGDLFKGLLAHELDQGSLEAFPGDLIGFLMILSRLVDTFFSRISLTMQLSPKPHNTAYVLPWEEGLHWQSRSSGCSSN